ncbi:MAG: GAF domain-containing protein, partial [Actinobacteria bacterium]|nr:GAF domain-containing protein [Actinomycetota bacterium]
MLTASNAHQMLCATDATVELLEDLQFSLGEGVCVEAAVTGRPVLVPDLHHSTEVSRWPIFAAAVVERSDVGALFAVPFQWETVNLGVLDLYRTAPGSLSDAQLRDVMRAADMAALMFLGLRTDPGEGAWLDQSLHGRAE